MKEQEETEGMQLRTRRGEMGLHGRDLVEGRVAKKEERGKGSAMQKSVGLNNFVKDRGGVMGFVKGMGLGG